MTPWLESATGLLSLLDRPSSPSEGDGVIIIIDDEEVERACASLLLLSSSPPSDVDIDNIDDMTLLPEDVRRIVETTRMRSLIRLRRFDEVVSSAARRRDDDDDDDATSTTTLEVAYGMYRSGKYEACRELCAGGGGGGGGGGGDASGRGLMHVHAQALYRLGMTDAADDVYRTLLLASSTTTTAVDADEREDALSNALANRIANHTPGAVVVVASSSESEFSGGEEEDDRGCWLEDIPDLRRLLLEDDGCEEDDVIDGPTSSTSTSTSTSTMRNYDLAYNLATYILVSRVSRPRSSVVDATNLLVRAERWATSIVVDENENENENDDHRRLLSERESNPIRANLAMARFILGGKENETEAYRAYLTLLSGLNNKGSSSSKGGKGRGASSSSASSASAIAIAEGNLLAATSNNLACLRDGKESPHDAYGRVTSSKLVGTTPHQARIALYNRALLLARSGNVKGCENALDALRASLRVSYRGDEGGRRGGGSRTSEGEGGPTSSSSSSSGRSGGGSTDRTDGRVKNGKKNKRGGARTAGATGAVADVSVGTIVGVADDDVLAAKPGSDVESIAWDARADLLESELRRMSESLSSSPSSSSSSSSSNDILDRAIAKLDAVMTSSPHDVGGALSYAKSQLLLHRAVVNDPSQRRSEAAIGTLESLPASVRSCPGAIVSLASLHDEAESAERVLSSLGDDRRAKLAVAELRIERGHYHAAVDLLRDIVEEGKGNNGDDHVDDNMEATAMLVKALSYTDPSKAEEYFEWGDQIWGAGGHAALLQEQLGGVSGEALEFMDIPRFAKQASLESNAEGTMGGSSKVRKLIAATGGKVRSSMGERKKKNRESILRKRSKQREAYLSRLESEGLRDPTKPSLSKPDPERWIPKVQRSYNNRRGRGGGRGKYKSNVGAQGGGAGPGMERDAAKLDVAARVAAAKSGSGDGDVGGGKQPSTANIKVTSTVARKGKGGKRR